jgi:hypothetical protein
MVERCQVTGGQDGILLDGGEGEIRNNRVRSTRLHGIIVNEMAMGRVVGNQIRGARGVGVYCGDYSLCEIEGNVVAGVRRANTSDRAKRGIGIVADYHATAELARNSVSRARARAEAFADAELVGD